MCSTSAPGTESSPSPPRRRAPPGRRPRPLRLGRRLRGPGRLLGGVHPQRDIARPVARRDRLLATGSPRPPGVRLGQVGARLQGRTGGGRLPEGRPRRAGAVRRRALPRGALPHEGTAAPASNASEPSPRTSPSSRPKPSISSTSTTRRCCSSMPEARCAPTSAIGTCPPSRPCTTCAGPPASRGAHGRRPAPARPEPPPELKVRIGRRIAGPPPPLPSAPIQLPRRGARLRVSHGVASPSRPLIRPKRASADRRLHGQPPDATSAATTAVGHLADSGLLEHLPSRVFLRGTSTSSWPEPHPATTARTSRNWRAARSARASWSSGWSTPREWSHAALMTEFGPSLHYGAAPSFAACPGPRRPRHRRSRRGRPLRWPRPHGLSLRFDELVVVDLPSEDRHAIYQDEVRPAFTETPNGPVTYRYHSMTDLNGLASESFDLVYSGQSMSTSPKRRPRACWHRCAACSVPGGVLALDTPNTRPTKLHRRPSSTRSVRVRAHGDGRPVGGQRLRRRARARGINYGRASVARGVVDPTELATKRGLYDAVEDCYLLAYVCRRPAVRAEGRSPTARSGDRLSRGSRKRVV